MDYYTWDNVNHPDLLALYDMNTLTAGKLKNMAVATAGLYDGTITGVTVADFPVIPGKAVPSMYFGGATSIDLAMHGFDWGDQHTIIVFLRHISGPANNNGMVIGKGQWAGDADGDFSISWYDDGLLPPGVWGRFMYRRLFVVNDKMWMREYLSINPQLPVMLTAVAGNGYQMLLRDGQVQSSYALENIGFNGNHVRIGGMGGGGGQGFWTGTIDYIMIFGTALTIPQIQSIRRSAFPATRGIFGKYINAQGPFLRPVPATWEASWLGDPWIYEEGGTYYLYYYGYSAATTHARVGLATSTDMNTWTRFGGNPILSEGGAGAWDEVHAHKGAVVKVGATYYMYYEGVDAAGLKCIGLATAAAPTGPWNKFGGNPILSPGVEPNGDVTINLQGPGIYYEGGTWYLYYNGQKVGPDFRWREYYATAPDGETFTRQNIILDVVPGTIEQGWLGFGNVLKLGTNKYLACYSFSSTKPAFAGDEPFLDGMSFLYSTDPVNFQRITHEAPLMTDNLPYIVWRGNINYIQNKYYLLLNGRAAVEELYQSLPGPYLFRYNSYQYG